MHRLLIPFILVALAGCPGPGKPEDALRAYWDAVSTGDFDAVYKRHCFIDQAVKSLEDFRQEMELTPAGASLLRVNQQEFDLRIDRSALRVEDTAEFDVTVTFPSGLKEKFHRLFLTVQRDSVVERPGQPPLLRCTGTCRVVKEHNGWFVFGDWENQRRREAEQAQARLDYLPFLKIRNISIRQYQNTHRYFLMFRVYNSGNRPVARIRLLLTFLTKENIPCQVLEDTVGLEAAVLKPHEQRSIKLDISSTPGDWSLNVTIKAVDCGWPE